MFIAFITNQQQSFTLEVTLPAEHSLEKFAKLFDNVLATNRKLLKNKMYVEKKILIFRRRKKIAKDSENIWVQFAKCYRVVIE